jgi:DNA-binding GntR family transcriptional regulator
LGGDFVPFSRQTAYGQIADAIRADILAGVYEPSPDDPTRDQLPGAAELGSQYGVSDKTAARAVQQLISEGLVLGRPGLRPVVVPRAQRPDRWPMNRRYARAREARGLVFGGDMQGRQVLKRTVHTGWTDVPEAIAALLRLDPGAQVWARARELLIDGRIAELSVSYFPATVAEGTGLMAPGDFPPGGVVGVLEDAGHRVLRTYNEARARPPGHRRGAPRLRRRPQPATTTRPDGPRDHPWHLRCRRRSLGGPGQHPAGRLAT